MPRKPSATRSESMRGNQNRLKPEPMVKKQFSLPERTVKHIEELADKLGLEYSTVVVRAVSCLMAEKFPERVQGGARETVQKPDLPG